MYSPPLAFACLVYFIVLAANKGDVPQLMIVKGIWEKLSFNFKGCF